MARVGYCTTSATFAVTRLSVEILAGKSYGSIRLNTFGDRFPRNSWNYWWNSRYQARSCEGGDWIDNTLLNDENRLHIHEIYNWNFFIWCLAKRSFKKKGKKKKNRQYVHRIAFQSLHLETNVNTLLILDKTVLIVTFGTWLAELLIFQNFSKPRRM